MGRRPANYREESACRSKYSYESKENAELVAKWNDFVENLRAYKCPYCKKWHLTSQPD